MTEEIAMAEARAQDAPAPEVKVKARVKAKVEAAMALDILQAARQATPRMTELAWCRAVHISYNHWCVLRRGESVPSIALILRAGDLADLRLCWAVQDAPKTTITTGDGA